MNRRRRIVIVGGTSAIAEHCARLWMAEGPTDLVLIGRSAQRLERVAADLRLRSAEAACEVVAGDLLDPNWIADQAARIAAAGAIDLVLIAHGLLADQAGCQADLVLCAQALNVNGVSPALWAEAFAGHLESVGAGTLALIGSVAGDRGRRSNYAYGAAKGLVDRYAQGLQHRFAGRPVRVVLIKPGPTETPMTAALTASGKRFASVETVARCIVTGIAAGRLTVYAPGRWRFIMAVIQHLPPVVFNRLNI